MDGGRGQVFVEGLSAPHSGHPVCEHISCVKHVPWGCPQMHCGNAVAFSLHMFKKLGSCVLRLHTESHDSHMPLLFFKKKLKKVSKNVKFRAPKYTACETSGPIRGPPPGRAWTTADGRTLRSACCGCARRRISCGISQSSSAAQPLWAAGAGCAPAPPVLFLCGVATEPPHK